MKYTYYYQDGTTKEVIREKMTLEELQFAVGGRIEIVPQAYYAHQKWGKCTVYVNEEGRFDSGNLQNPFFKELEPGFDVVGLAIKESSK